MHPGMPWVTLGNLRLWWKIKIRNNWGSAEVPLQKLFVRLVATLSGLRGTSYLFGVTTLLTFCWSRSFSCSLYYCHQISVICVFVRKTWTSQSQTRYHWTSLTMSWECWLPKVVMHDFARDCSKSLSTTIFQMLIELAYLGVSPGCLKVAMIQDMTTVLTRNCSSLLWLEVSRFSNSQDLDLTVIWFANPNPPTSHRCDATYELSAIIDRSTIINHLINHYFFTNRVTIINQS